MFATEELQLERNRLAQETVTPFNIKQFLVPQEMLKNVLYCRTMQGLPKQSAHFIRGVIRHMGELGTSEAQNREHVNMFIDTVFQVVDDLITSARLGRLDRTTWFRNYVNSRGILRTLNGKLIASPDTGLFTNSIYSDLFTRYFLSYVA